MWPGFSIHEVIKKHRGRPIVREQCTNTGFHSIGTPLNKVIEFCTLHKSFPKVTQTLFPNECLDTILGHHLHFTQILHHERANKDTNLIDDFHINMF